jgi:acetoacetyl-CoA synthetase
MSSCAEGDVVWTPDRDRCGGNQLTVFAETLRRTGTIDGADYRTLWRWSVDHPADFWSAVADDARIQWHRRPSEVLRAASMPGAQWFAGGTLNYVDAALRRRDDTVAVICEDESGDRRTLTWAELAEQVRQTAAGLRRLGVSIGDRVAAYVPNRVEALVAFLATASIGAIWTATSPDFGEQSVLDRFEQVAPRVLLAVSGYRYNGRWHDRRDVVTRLAEELPSLEHVVALPGGEPIGGAMAWAELTGATDEPLRPTAVPFDHPLWIVYTSGTTGRPKSIVHGHGGIVLEHHKLLRLHLDLGPDDRFFWYSTTGWVMWNIVVGGLLVGVPIVLYDGSPNHPGAERLWDLAAELGVTFLGLSAGFIQRAMRADHEPGRGRDLTAVRAIGVTGSPLPAAGYPWLLDRVGPETFIASISGGTDVATAFVGCTRTLPVRAGMLQAACLGVDAVALDESGRELVGETGELVVRQPIPSMPVSFWGDEDGERYWSSYFDQYPGYWRHGDWVRFEPDGSCVVVGRSDATLNRAGVRMGTGDFYSVLEAMPTVADALVIDTTSAEQPDGRLVLIVQPADGVVANDEFSAVIRAALRGALSPRHNPDDIVVVDRLCHTLNGKRLEVPAKRLFMGARLEDASDPSAVDDRDALRMLADAAAEWRSAHVATDAN